MTVAGRTDQSDGKGQYRLRSGRFRFRYDVAEREVVLLYCGLRRGSPSAGLSYQSNALGLMGYLGLLKFRGIRRDEQR